jgi:exonuclease III
MARTSQTTAPSTRRQVTPRGFRAGADGREAETRLAVRLLTWNLNARRDIGPQVAAIAARTPDILALQELTRYSVSLLRKALPAAGLPHLIDSFANSAPWFAVGPRRYGLLTASQHPITSVPTISVVLWPERILSADVLTPGGAVRVHTTHIPPGSSNQWKKVDMLEAVLDVVSEPYPTPLILCGDFNMPQAETALGRIVTWAQRLKPGAEPRLRARWRGRDALRWDLAERRVMEAGRQRQLVDAFRYLHGYEREEFSWFLKRGALGTGRRFDHIFCSPDLRSTRCEYLHEFRESGLSDHAPLELDFEL